MTSRAGWSSSNSTLGAAAVTVAVRERPERAEISPKNAPSPSPHRGTSCPVALRMNTFTFLGGPRLVLGGTNDQPYAHLLGGARLDKIAGRSNTRWGGAAGLGVDLGTGGRRGGTRFRLGADFEMFFESGQNVKALRLTAGLTF